MFTREEKERALYEARLKAVMDERSRLADAIDEGKKLGLEEGAKKARKEMVIACLQSGIDLETIRKLTGASLEEIENIRGELGLG